MTVRFIGSLIKYLIYISLILIAAGAALFWFDTGSWLVKPIAERAAGFFLHPTRLEISTLEGSLRNGYTLDGLRLISGDKDILTLSHASISPDWDLILAGSDGLPYVKSLTVKGLSSDLESVNEIASLFASSNDETPSDNAPINLKINPANVAIEDVFFGTPYADLLLDALTLDDAGNFTLNADMISRDNIFPLRMKARMKFSPAEIVSSDLHIGSKGTGKLSGTLEPLKARLDLTALSLEEIMSFIPASLDASGRIDGRILAEDSDGIMTASGVVAMPRASIMDIPLNFRLPFTYSTSNTFTLDGATLTTKAAAFTLRASGDINAMRYSAKGEGRNISLTEIGRMFAPESGLIGEGGYVSFNASTAISPDIMQTLFNQTTADIKAEIPGVTAMGINAAENVSAHVKLTPGKAPGISLSGKAFGGKLFARGEAIHDADGSIKPDGVVVSVVNLDIPTLMRAVPQLSGMMKDVNPSGKITARAKISEALRVNTRITSDRLGAYGVALTGIDADADYDVRNQTAELHGLTANFGRGRITASGGADIGSGKFHAHADGNNIELRNIPQLKQVEGSYGVKAEASGNFNDLKSIKAEAVLTARNAGYAGVRGGNADIPASMAGGVVKVSDASIRFPGSSANLNAHANIIDTSFNVKANADNLDLRFIPQLKQLAGRYTAKIDASGKYSDIKTITADAHITAKNAGYNGIKLGDAEIPATFRNGVVTVSNARANLPGGSANLNATANINDSTFKADADIRNLDLRFIPELKRVSGKYSAKVDASGKYTDINAITANARITATNAGYDGMNFGNADIPLSIRSGVVHVNSARASLPGGNLTLNGNANVRNINNPVIDLTASTNGVNIARLLNALNVKGANVSGNASGFVTVRGNAKSPSFNVKLEAANVKAAGVADIPSALIKAEGNMKKVYLKDIQAKFNGATITGAGNILPDMNNVMASRMNIDTTLKRLDLKALLKKFMEKPPVDGVIDAKAGIRGTFSQPVLDLQLTKPIYQGKTEINDIAASVRSPRPNHFRVNAKARIGTFKPEADIDIRNNNGVIAYTVDSKPLDINSAIETQMPAMSGIAKGYATVHVQGSTAPNSSIIINAKSPEISIIDKVKVQDIAFPVTYYPSKSLAEMKRGTAKLSDGAITSSFTADMKENLTEWRSSVKVEHLDLGKLAAPFMPEGELVGKADANMTAKGTSTQYITLSFADGKFSTGPGCLRKIAILDRVTPTKQISFEKINGSFFWDGKDLFLNPGTGARAGNDEPLYRYFTINGAMGIPGKGLKLLCDGRFDLKLLDQLLGAMKGIFQYMTGSLMRSVLRDAAGRVLGVKSRDYQNVSFTLANSWQDLHLRNLQVTKPIEDILPIDILNRDEEKQKETTQFNLRLKIPTGKGDPSIEEESPGDQFKKQLIDNLFNIGM